ncbi:alcohol dehydrogenase catalytic domain-containing protein [Mycobacterium sp. Marseille-P9652]|uniref:alcohol dehydrogenase catalytic domain-containing protein n=1 Tax=Mycobacterium sp. Marseille-P9652 TaxID=2654950 RepID=UPI0012E8E547|nr:alcohol dehydrogenase catalytic domain-containing protein [Mycobacterium sp. Marseille-P9652]
MKAVVYQGPAEISLESVADPLIEQPGDAIVRITRSAICGTDLHAIRGTLPGMIPGTVLGHEAVGEVADVGPECRAFNRGDRVVVASLMGCGACRYCREGIYAQCDRANPNGPLAGTCFFGGPEATGPINGLQAEFARIPFASTNLTRIPDEVSDDEAILVSDVFPTGWFGACLAGVQPGRTVAVFGAGPVGQFAALSAKLQGAGRVMIVDGIESRLALARNHNVETIDFNAEDPVATIRELTNGAGVDCVVDAVGIDAQAPRRGPVAATTAQQAEEFSAEQHAAAPHAHLRGDVWRPGDAPSQASRWAAEAVAKAGTIGIVGVYAPGFSSWPIGTAMMRNLTVRMGNANHPRFIPQLLELVRGGTVRPTDYITQGKELTDAIEAYETFDQRREGWLKTVLDLA